MSRLRNRIRKADYFSDGELLRWPRDKRTTYSGLWAIAEDTGCLEDDTFEWKMSLWPSPLDADITVEVLAQWRDELIEAGKLIPYESDGKPYLFIRTFHQHEHPTNPQKPDLPVPPWVRVEVTDGRAKDGKKWSRCTIAVSPELMPSRARVGTDSVQSQNGVSTDSVRMDFEVPSPVQSCPDQSGVKNTPLPPKPVDKSADQERGDEQAHQGQGQSCDGRPCSIREFPASAFAPLKRAIDQSQHPGLWHEVGKGGEFDDTLARYADHLCAACQASFAEQERPQRDRLCERAVIGGVENLQGAEDVHAVIRSRLVRWGLGELIGDRLLEELRRTKRRRTHKSDPTPVGNPLAERTTA